MGEIAVFITFDTAAIMYYSVSYFEWKGLSMYLQDTQISCGISQLVDVGAAEKKNTCDYCWHYGDCVDDKCSCPLPKDHPNQEDYNEVVKGARTAMIIASLTSNQKREIKLLKKNGFKQVGKNTKNPNGGNMIGLYVKQFKQKRKKKKSKAVLIKKVARKR